MATKANIKGDLWEMKIGGTAGPWHVSISLADMLTLFPVKSGRTGSSTVTTLVEGHGGTITVEVEEWAGAEIRRALGIASGNAPPAVGTQMPAHSVNLHNPLDAATVTDDIHFFACVFSNFRRTHDGQGQAGMSFDLKPQMNDDGNIWQIGEPA